MRGLRSVIVLLGLSVGLAHALDAPVLGTKLLVRDRKPGVDPTKRAILVRAKEKASENPLMGSPDRFGATVTVFTFGATSASQAFVLPPGIDSTSGKPFWTVSATGFTYRDPKLTAGAVRIARITKSAKGTFQIGVVVVGKRGAMTVVPPNPGTSGCVRLDLDQGAVRYHVLLPPVPNATVKKNDDATFLIEKATLEGTCPVPAAVCGNGILEPGERCDGGPFCTASCFLDIPACCATATQCVDTLGFSLVSLIFEHCATDLPGFTQVLTGGVCQPDGSCSRETIAPLSVCCQHPGAGACEDATVADTGDLYNFFAACQGPQTGAIFLGAVCVPSGTCIQG